MLLDSHFRQWRRLVIRYKFSIGLICLALIWESFSHVHNIQSWANTKPTDPPYQIGCRQLDATTPRENAVILMLARNQDVAEAVEAVQSFEKAFNRFYQYPIVFLNNEPFDAVFKARLSSATNSTTSFHQIDSSQGWGPPEHMDPSSVRAKMDEERRRFRGQFYTGNEDYHNMCRFQSRFFFNHPALKQYRWYWRIEPDVRADFNSDPFYEMAKRGHKYGWVMALWEVGKTCPSLFRQISDYKQRNGLATNSLWASMLDPSYLPWPFRKLLRFVPHRDAEGDAWNLCHWWSNFEIVDMDWYRGIEYTQLLEVLDTFGGFYHERWGDAPIHSLAAALLLKPEEVHYFRDIGYIHSRFQYCPGNAKNQQSTNVKDLGFDRVDEPVSSGLGCACFCDYNYLIPQDYCAKRLAGKY